MVRYRCKDYPGTQSFGQGTWVIDSFVVVGHLSSLTNGLEVQERARPCCEAK